MEISQRIRFLFVFIEVNKSLVLVSIMALLIFTFIVRAMLVIVRGLTIARIILITRTSLVVRTAL